MTAYPPPGLPACSSSVGHVAAGWGCPVCGHSGYAHPPMSAGPCGICEAVVEARDAVAEVLAAANDTLSDVLGAIAEALGEAPPSGRRPRHRAS